MWNKATLDANGGHTPECEGSCHPSCPIGQEHRIEANRREVETQRAWAAQRAWEAAQNSEAV
jgi:hypothetical protein